MCSVMSCVLCVLQEGPSSCYIVFIHSLSATAWLLFQLRCGNRQTQSTRKHELQAPHSFTRLRPQVSSAAASHLAAGHPLLSASLSSPQPPAPVSPLIPNSAPPDTHTCTHAQGRTPAVFVSVCHLVCWHLRPGATEGETAICRRPRLSRSGWEQATAMHHAALFCSPEPCEESLRQRRCSFSGENVCDFI